MKRLLPLLLVFAGLFAGLGAGWALRPPPAPAEGEEARPASGADPEEGADGAPLHEFARMGNQFIVPVVEGDAVAALVILSLSLEVKPGLGEIVYAREPKLRDAFLRVLFAHANAGGFRGSFTENTTLASLRQALVEAARSVVGPDVTNVLIMDLVRQDS